MKKIFLPLIAEVLTLTFRVSCSESSFRDGACYELIRLDKGASSRYYSDTNTPEACKSNCADWGYDLAGVQKFQCFCGNNTQLAERRRHSSQCSLECPGDNSLKCGGDFGMNIYKTEGRWSSWSEWSGCSASCGQGAKTRSRSCSRKGQCLGESRQRSMCDLPHCEDNSSESPAGCSCSEFINPNGYGQCRKLGWTSEESVFCYVTMPSTCTDLIESKTNPGQWHSTQPCKNKSKNLILSSWSEWSTCSASGVNHPQAYCEAIGLGSKCSCGDGKSTRTRLCSEEEGQCPGETRQSIKCDFISCNTQGSLDVKNEEIYEKEVFSNALALSMLVMSVLGLMVIYCGGLKYKARRKTVQNSNDSSDESSIELRSQSGYLSQVRRRSSLFFQEFVASAPPQSPSAPSYVSTSSPNSLPPPYAQVCQPPVFSVDPPQYSTLSHQS